jgi:general secretion pathway protein M
MISVHSIARCLTRYPSISGGIYVALIALLCLTNLFMLADIVEGYYTRNTSLETLSRLEGRHHLTSAEHDGAADSWPPGSPFLEGLTATTASASLLQRFTGTISHVGGIVISSEMQQGARSKDGYVTAIANCELEQEALQKVLYEIEAGQPFLFIDQLVVQTQTLPGESKPLRVMLSVTGLWPGEK